MSASPHQCEVRQAASMWLSKEDAAGLCRVRWRSLDFEVEWMHGGRVVGLQVASREIYNLFFYG